MGGDSESDTSKACMHPRAARIKLAATQDLLSHLEFARRAKMRVDGDTTVLDEQITQARNAVVKYAGLADARIDKRRHTPTKQPISSVQPRKEYLVFLDECGTHTLSAGDTSFPVFCLCSVIVAADEFARFDTAWKTWKTKHLGNVQARVHEPQVRKQSYLFYRENAVEQAALIASLDQQLSELDFVCIAAVIDKRRFSALHPEGTVDDFLPTSGYLMCIDFLFERIVHFLCFAGGDARGNTIAESRGPKEDAEVHAEFLRLQLEGTQWQSEQQFRHSLRPYIEFHRKDGDLTGLEIADLFARPIADKVLNPASTPARWNIVLPKIYDGGKSRKSSYGLKIFPAIESDLIFGETATE